MIRYLIKKFNLLTGFMFWFEYSLKYYSKGRYHIEKSVITGMPTKGKIINRRYMVKQNPELPNIKKANCPKDGFFIIENISYIGYFKK